MLLFKNAVCLIFFDYATSLNLPSSEKPRHLIATPLSLNVRCQPIHHSSLNERFLRTPEVEAGGTITSSSRVISVHLSLFSAKMNPSDETPNPIPNGCGISL